MTGTGDDQETHYPMGQYGDIFTATDRPGLLLLHSPGNTFIRDLRPGESLLIQPSSLLYRDVSVSVHLHLEYPRNMGFAFWHPRWSYRNIWVRLDRPGPRRGPVGVRAAREHRYDPELVVRHAPPLVDPPPAGVPTRSGPAGGIPGQA